MSLPPPPHIDVHSLHPFRHLVARELTNIVNGVPPMTTNLRIVYALKLVMVVFILAFVSIVFITATAKLLQQRLNIPVFQRPSPVSPPDAALRHLSGRVITGGSVSPPPLPPPLPPREPSDFMEDLIDNSWGYRLLDINASGLRKRTE